MKVWSENIDKNNKITIQDFAFFWLIGAAIWHWWKFFLAPSVDLKPLPVASVNIETTVGNKVAQILIPNGECRIDEKWNYTLILDKDPKASIDWMNITRRLPNKNSGHYPNFLVSKFAWQAYDFWWLEWICEEYRRQLLGFIVNAVKMEIDTKASTK